MFAAVPSVQTLVPRITRLSIRHILADSRNFLFHTGTDLDAVSIGKFSSPKGLELEFDYLLSYVGFEQEVFVLSAGG